jgi:hypothetical protein
MLYGQEGIWIRVGSTPTLPQTSLLRAYLLASGINIPKTKNNRLQGLLGILI